MATNTKEYTKNYTTKNRERLREYMREYKRTKRAETKGFNLALARRLFRELIKRGVDVPDARWCVIDAANRGCFGFCR